MLLVWYNKDSEREVIKMKGNSHKKDYAEDKFARHYYCQHARLNQVRTDKKASRRKTRRKLKKDLTNQD